MAQQRYSYVGIVIIVLMIIAILYLLFHHEEIPHPKSSDEEIALRMQCHDRHGLLAISKGPLGEWIACYQGRKKIWGVKL